MRRAEGYIEFYAIKTRTGFIITVQKYLAIIFLLLSAQFASAQTRYTLNGYIRDSLSGELIIGATITIEGQSKGVTSNAYGFYSITLDPGTYYFTISHVSYQLKKIIVELQGNVQQNVEMLSKSAVISEVVIYTKRRDENVKTAQMSKVDLSMDKIKNIPAFMGEIDLLKVIQLLPGVRNAGEGNAGFYVRGGGPDQNLVRLCCRAWPYLDNLTYSQPRRINAVLARCQDVIANFNFLESRNVTHFKQTFFTQAPDRAERSRPAKLSHNCTGRRLFISDHHHLRRPRTQSNHATDYAATRNHGHVESDTRRTAAVNRNGVEPDR